MQKAMTLILLLLVGTLLFGCVDTSKPASTFTIIDNAPICAIDNKPVIRLYSTTWCPHCIWIKPTYEKVVQEYVAQGKIVAYHWEVDILDDTLTPQNEQSIPEEEMSLFKSIAPNGNIPAFLFGCMYYRIGNGYEGSKDLASEEAEFRRIINELIS